MRGYTHMKPRKAKECDWCEEKIPAKWATYMQGSHYYHVRCAHERERFFKDVLGRFAGMRSKRREIEGRTT